MRGLFVTGTGTGVGKTVLSAALLAAMREAGERVRAHKPVVTGLDETPAGAVGTADGGWPPDHELLGAAAGMGPEEVAPRRYGPAVSPHLAARLAGEEIDSDAVIARAREAVTALEETGGEGDGTGESIVVVEGVGGLLVPLTDGLSVRDLAAVLGLPVLIAARPGLGTINHTLLTLESARVVGLEVRAVVLTPWPAEPLAMERSNRETIARLGEIEVAGLGQVARATTEALARAGDRLPWRRWCAPESFIPDGS
jgi:dethiobiotin synthetase